MWSRYGSFHERLLIIQGTKILSGTTVIESFEVNYRWGRYRAGGSLPFSVTLYSCEEEVPPKYNDYYTGTKYMVSG